MVILKSFKSNSFNLGLGFQATKSSNANNKAGNFFIISLKKPVNFAFYFLDNGAQVFGVIGKV